MPKTTKAMISQMTTRLAGDINTLSTQRENAVSTFRRTANELETINTNLRQNIAEFDELMKFISEQRGSAEQMVSDNERVKGKILEIIGD